MSTEITALTKRAVDLSNSRFGKEGTFDFNERSRRNLEESIELFQATGGTETEALRLVFYTFNRKVGEPFQELGGNFFTLLLAANALGFDIADALTKELDRFEALPLDMVQAKLASKKAAGISPYGG
jgi:hypothetical protein